VECAFESSVFFVQNHCLQVQLEEEKLKQTSFTKGSVFIDGVEFVKVSSAAAQYWCGFLFVVANLSQILN